MSPYVAFDHISGNILIITPPAPIKPKRRRKKHSFWQEAPYHFAFSEESLWKAVITQAVVDACSRNPRTDYLSYKKEATQWLTGGSEDFIDVCLRAGLDPDHVRMQAKKSLMHPSLWRAAPKTGWRYEEKRRWRTRRKFGRETESQPLEPAPTCLIIHPFT
ncbi:MAG: hypothetical protein SFX19_09065 [Alphaproteobacteria bacterium]|nr:hypothetical protein [Alphaproteobacteria bacterium]